ncbi:thioredoxin [Patescibacteria group bacterium]|nr:thioredoxin [Patescibacteria group bacterium]
MAELHFTDDNFEQEVLKEKEKPVLVDFFATWCPPCKMLGPIVEELAKDFEGKAKIGKIDVDQNKKYAGQYKVQSIPTIILFKKGEAVETVMGLQSKEKLTELINKYL